MSANGEREREEGPPPACIAGGGKIRGKIGFWEGSNYICICNWDFRASGLDLIYEAVELQCLPQLIYFARRLF